MTAVLAIAIGVACGPPLEPHGATWRVRRATAANARLLVVQHTVISLKGRFLCLAPANVVPVLEALGAPSCTSVLKRGEPACLETLVTARLETVRMPSLIALFVAGSVTIGVGAGMSVLERSPYTSAAAVFAGLSVRQRDFGTMCAFSCARAIRLGLRERRTQHFELGGCARKLCAFARELCPELYERLAGIRSIRERLCAASLGGGEARAELTGSALGVCCAGRSLELGRVKRVQRRLDHGAFSRRGACFIREDRIHERDG
jgi:hypothetical protein